MSEPVIELKVGGKSYQVVTTAGPEELARLAEHVERAIAEVSPEGREVSSQALILAAITLAHDLEEEREARKNDEQRYRKTLESLLKKVDAVLGESEPLVAVNKRRSSAQTSSSSVT